MLNNVQVIAGTVVELARIAFYAYAVYAAKEFALQWLAMGAKPLLQSRAAAQEAAIDAARKAGIEVTDFREAAHA